ncbi:MAG: response regulator [Alphaproteobacteria bacterium]|nr:response regulator [Alphaproteobacteria bacterium]
MPRQEQGNSAAARLSGVSILVVEDEALIAMEIAATLEDEGATVLGPASTVFRGLKYAKAEPLSAAVLDLRLNAESVAPVARILASRGIPFLFYSGQIPSDPILAEWPDVPAIEKPALPGAIIEALERLLEMHRHPDSVTNCG